MATIYQNGIQYSGSGEPLIYDDMGGATSTTGGVHGLVPAPSAGDNEKFLSGDGSWKKPGEYITKTATGNPIEISDGASAPMVRCVTQITGSQDLHGYDKPWVGGAGKNKLPNIMESPQTVNGITATPNDDGTITINGTATANTNIYFNNRFILPQGSYIFSGSNGGSSSTYGLFLNNGSDNLFVYDGEVSFTSDGVTQIYVAIRVVSGVTVNNVKLYPMLRASGTTADFAPYSNICPITAYTEGEIEVRGRNLLETTATTSTVAGITYTPQSDGSIKYSGTASGASEYVINDHVPLKVSMGTVILSGLANTDNLLWNSFYLYDENGTNIGSVTVTGKADKTIDLSNYTGLSYGRIAVKRNANIQCSGTIYPMIRYASVSDSTWEPYIAPTTHTTTYPSAIYRGSEDVVNGTVGANSDGEMWVKEVFDGSSDEQWSFSVNAGFRNQNVAYMLFPAIATSQTPIANLFEGLSNRAYGDLNNWQCSSPISSGSEKYINFVVDKTLITSLSDWKTWLSNNNLEVAYKVQTPTTEDVTPTNLPIRTLSGYNHIESSTGDMEVEYITQEYQPLVDLIADGGGTSSDDYITEETLIGSWLGTPLYRRVIEISGNKASGGYYTLLNDSTINLIKYEGCVQNQYWTGAGCMLNSYYSESQYCGCAYSSNDGARIDWYNNLGMTISKIYLIIYYTKK